MKLQGVQLHLQLIPLQHIICFSGGIASALVAIEVVRRYGKANVILCNHDISSSTEHPDIKRFKREVADYLGLLITFVNHQGIADPDELPDQFDVCVAAKAFKVGAGSELCTNRLKTDPFLRWLKPLYPPGTCIIYYGFEGDEPRRVDRRARIMRDMGHDTCYPLAEWEQTINDLCEVGIEPPSSYEYQKHGNCLGCLKAGRQHWYVVFCLRLDFWKKAKRAEEKIGYTILKGLALLQLEPLFEAMQAAGVPATEQIPSGQFWALVRRTLGKELFDSLRPVEQLIHKSHS